jgi:hypothetical protein
VDSLLPQPGLIYLAETGASIQYSGDANLYHNLNAYVERPSKESFTDRKELLINNLESFQEFVLKNKGKDQSSLEVDRKTSPWNNPPSVTDELLFQLKSEYHGQYGLKETWFGKMRAPALAAKTPQPASKIKIVDPNDKVTPGVLANVAQALAGAQDGDVILIKHPEGEPDVVMPPVALKPGISVTLKSFDGCHARLMLDKAFKDKDAALFKVHDGKLQIENIEIVLDPGQAGFETQSIVHLGETAHCAFKNCVLTLRAANGVPLNVVTFVDVDRMMKMPAPSTARVEFQECFIRGKGDLVSLRGARLLYVDMKSSMVALDGSLLDIESGNKTMPMNQGVRWKMERSSIFTTESIFALHSRTAKGLTETQAEIDGCLIASLVQKQPLVYLEIDPLDKFVKWKGEQNYYANFDKDWMRYWKGLYPEMKSEFGTLALPEFKEDMVPRMWEATPDWFKLSDADAKTVSDYGIPALVEKRLMPATPDPDE